MSGFEGDKSSQPKWTTDFEDWQIGNKGTEPVIENEYARWKIYVNVTNTEARRNYCWKVILFYFLIDLLKVLKVGVKVNQTSYFSK